MTRFRPAQMQAGGATTGQTLVWNGTIWAPSSTFVDATKIPYTLFDAKGDLLLGTASDAGARLAVGTNGQILIADSTQTTGVRWGAAPATGISVQDENGTAITSVTQLDFQGAGVTAAAGTGEVIVTVPGGASKHIIEDEGVDLVSRSQLNFVGAGVTATDDSVNDRTILTIPGGGGGSGHLIEDEGVDLAARTQLNFVGTGVTVTDDAPNDRSIVTIPGAGTPGHIIEDEGVDRTTRGQLNFVGTGVTVTDDAPNDRTIVTIPSSMSMGAVGTFIGTLAVTTGAVRFYNDSDTTLTIRAVRASVVTVPTGSGITVDVNKNGTTIFTNQANRPQIAASGFTGSTTVIDVSAWAPGDYLTLDIDAVGSTIAGADLTVQITVS